MRRSTLALTALLGATLHATAADIPPAIVVLAIDTSGSIAPSDAERTRQLALDLLGALPAGSEVALLTFDDQSRLVVPRTDKAESLKTALAGIRPSGRYTALYDALYEASRYLRAAPSTRRAVVLVTDGRDENSALNLDDGLGDARDSGIPIETVGIGSSEERVLRRIAKLTGGEYVPIASASGLAIAGQILALPPPAPAPPLTTAIAPTTLATAAARPTAPPPSRGRTALGLGLMGTAGVAVLLALIALVTRKPRPPALASIAATSEEPAAALALDEGPSPTIVGRLDTSEEALEKTITLTDEPRLVVEGGALSGQVFLLSRETTTSVGRARANDVVLDDVAVSSQHCRLRQEAGHFVLHDLQSTNGTFVNEQKVSRHILKPGELVRVGETQLRFSLGRKRG